VIVKTINGKKVVEIPFTVSYNLCVEEHQFLEYATWGITIENLQQVGKETLVDVTTEAMKKNNEGWETIMIEVA
jgi:hypothetical protein